MKHTDLHETLFEIERLRNAVNVGRCSAYQIYTNPGKTLGRIGTVINPTAQIPANEREFHGETGESTAGNVPMTWFRKALHALKS